MPLWHYTASSKFQCSRSNDLEKKNRLVNIIKWWLGGKQSISRHTYPIIFFFYVLNHTVKYLHSLFSDTVYNFVEIFNINKWLYTEIKLLGWAVSKIRTIEFNLHPPSWKMASRKEGPFHSEQNPFKIWSVLYDKM